MVDRLKLAIMVLLGRATVKECKRPHTDDKKNIVITGGQKAEYDRAVNALAIAQGVIAGAKVWKQYITALKEFERN